MTQRSRHVSEEWNNWRCFCVSFFRELVYKWTSPTCLNGLSFLLLLVDIRQNIWKNNLERWIRFIYIWRNVSFYGVPRSPGGSTLCLIPLGIFQELTLFQKPKSVLQFVSKFRRSISTQCHLYRLLFGLPTASSIKMMFLVFRFTQHIFIVQKIFQSFWFIGRLNSNQVRFFRFFLSSSNFVKIMWPTSSSWKNSRKCQKCQNQIYLIKY